ncbi:MAG: hypothetical protein IPF64_11370 [Flavobacteriales bacterium]|nr:hypothetical protein [Flavobacteriales bacterium]
MKPSTPACMLVVVLTALPALGQRDDVNKLAVMRARGETSLTVGKVHYDMVVAYHANAYVADMTLLRTARKTPDGWFARVYGPDGGLLMTGTFKDQGLQIAQGDFTFSNQTGKRKAKANSATEAKWVFGNAGTIMASRCQTGSTRTVALWTASAKTAGPRSRVRYQTQPVESRGRGFLWNSHDFNVAPSFNDPSGIAVTPSLLQAVTTRPRVVTTKFINYLHRLFFFLPRWNTSS